MAYTKIKINGDGQYSESVGMFQKESQNGPYYSGTIKLPENMVAGTYSISAFPNKNYVAGSSSPRFNILISKRDEDAQVVQQTTQDSDLPF